MKLGGVDVALAVQAASALSESQATVSPKVVPTPVPHVNVSSANEGNCSEWAVVLRHKAAGARCDSVNRVDRREPCVSRAGTCFADVASTVQ